MDNRSITWGIVVSSLSSVCLTLYAAIHRIIRLFTRFPEVQDSFLRIALRLLIAFALAMCGLWLLVKSWRQASAGSDNRKPQSVLFWIGGGAALACAGLVLVGALTDTVRLYLRVPAAESMIWSCERRLLIVFLTVSTAARLLLKKLRRRGAERRAREEEDKAFQDFERRLREWDE